jgi:hypothetical protein
MPSFVIARSTCDEAIHLAIRKAREGRMDCFASLAMTLRAKRPSYPGSFNSSGTAASYLELCSTSEVLTLRTCGAAVRWVTKS